jgi:hypothetical protein
VSDGIDAQGSSSITVATSTFGYNAYGIVREGNSRDVEVQDATPIMADDKEAVEEAKRKVISLAPGAPGGY